MIKFLNKVRDLEGFLSKKLNKDDFVIAQNLLLDINDSFSLLCKQNDEMLNKKSINNKKLNELESKANKLEKLCNFLIDDLILDKDSL